MTQKTKKVLEDLAYELDKDANRVLDKMDRAKSTKAKEEWRHVAIGVKRAELKVLAKAERLR